jgi:arylsulfatase A-like enzyme
MNLLSRLLKIVPVIVMFAGLWVRTVSAQPVGKPQTSGGDARQPNIVYILADDLGWTDLGCQGSTFYETPHIDRLAASGLRLTNYHNCQNCQPTRAALMTGQYAARTGVYTVGGIDRFDWTSRPLRPVDNVEELSLDRITIAQSLKAAGYATAIFGKWHLGETGPHHPGRRGFDEAITSAGRHVNFTTRPKVDVPEGTWLADFLTDRAEEFIRKHRSGPFFLYLPHFGVHSPNEAPEERIARFRDKSPAGGHHSPVYAAMISQVDDSVGRIVALLDELDLTDNTIVIFSSDNGGVGGYEREGLNSAGITDNAPLRSGKGSLYEGGTRVPFIVRWPGVTPAGSTCDVPAIHVDVFPTLLTIAGASPPEGQPLDGESLTPLFHDPAAQLSRHAIFQHFPGYLGAGAGKWRTTPVGVVQAGNWKLMEFFEDHRLELYNLADDISESRNLAADNPGKLAELQALMTAWRTSVNAPMPQPNTDPRPAQQGKGKGKRKNAARVGD